MHNSFLQGLQLAEQLLNLTAYKSHPNKMSTSNEVELHLQHL